MDALRLVVVVFRLAALVLIAAVAASCGEAASHYQASEPPAGLGPPSHAERKPVAARPVAPVAHAPRRLPPAACAAARACVETATRSAWLRPRGGALLGPVQIGV